MASTNFNADARRLTDTGNKCAERLNEGNANWKRLVNRGPEGGGRSGDEPAPTEVDQEETEQEEEEPED